jgi:quinolinate synthase
MSIPAPTAPDDGYAAWAREVRDLAERRNAVILAHNYQVPWIQDVADHLGDSLALSRAAAASDAEVIVFCGVHFMAETAKILAPDRTVLIPDPGAGCSLADTITAGQVRAWRAEHPGALVVAYVNTSAEVKAEADVCCTSSNAVEVVESLPAGREVLFLPDMFLGQHVRRQTDRTIHVWMGECHVHAGISPADLKARVAAEPAAELYVHPECGCTTAALWLASEGELPAERTAVLSTGAMVERARTARPGAKVLVATETGILHQLRAANPATTFEPVNERAVCGYMKMITPEKLLRTLRDGVFEVTVEPRVAERAAAAVEAMIAVGRPSATGE